MPVNEQWLRFAFWTAGANWLTWIADFEFSGKAERLPVLNKKARYRAFVKSYGLLQGYTNDKRELLRKYLSESNDLQLAIEAPDGSGIDRLSCSLLDAKTSHSRLVSFSSKLVAFARPDSFIAWDKYARNGVAKLAHGPKDGKYQVYSDFLLDVNKTLQGEIGGAIARLLVTETVPTKNHDAFKRRVLDVYLMVCGGRWSAELDRT